MLSGELLPDSMVKELQSSSSKKLKEEVYTPTTNPTQDQSPAQIDTPQQIPQTPHQQINQVNHNNQNNQIGANNLNTNATANSNVGQNLNTASNTTNIGNNTNNSTSNSKNEIKQSTHAFP